MKTDAVNAWGAEFLPADAVAAPVAGRLSVPRTVVAPLTSRVLVGVVVLTPVLAVAPVPDWNNTELPSAPELFVHRGRKSAVPVPDTAAVEMSAGADAVDEELLPAATGTAGMNAEAGSPPRVCASAAFNA